MVAFPSFAFVRFLCDGQKSIVPCSFIKGFKPEEFVPGTRAPVFWSPEDGESPSDILRSQGIVLDVDKLPERKGKKAKGVIAGYYNADILKVAESEKELSDLIDHKRIHLPTTKVAETLEMKLQNSREKAEGRSSQNKSDAYVSKAKVMNLIKEGQSLTLDELDKKYGSEKHSDDSSSSSSGKKSPSKSELKRKLKTLEDDLASSRKRNKRLTSENKHLTDEVGQLRRLNYNLQEKFIPAAPPKNCSKTAVKGLKTVKKNLFENQTVIASRPNSAWTSSPGKNKSNSNNDLSSTTAGSSTVIVVSPASAETSNSADVSSPEDIDSLNHSPTSAGSSTIIVVSPDRAETNNSEDISSPKDIDSINRSPGTSNKKDSEVELQLNLTPKKMNKVMIGVHPKVRGDSVFIKNLAVAIFGVDLLIQSSFSGRKYSRDTHGDARPALPSKGMDYLQECFFKRMAAEKPSPTETEMELRATREVFRKSLSDKIKDLRKPKQM